MTRRIPFPPRALDEAVLFDMHVHSRHSGDSVVSVGTIVRAWERTGVLPLVCDHNSIEGAREVYARIRRQDPDVPQILAEEISTRDGEIIGAFLTEEIPPGLSAAETLEIIRDQGGLSIVPHPFCTHRLCTIDRGVLQNLIGRIDAVEGCNARNRSPEADLHARAFAREHKKPVSAGSDAHTPAELATAYVVVAPFEGPEDLLANLRDAPVCHIPADPPFPSVARRIGRSRRTVG